MISTAFLMIIIGFLMFCGGIVLRDTTKGTLSTLCNVAGIVGIAVMALGAFILKISLIVWVVMATISVFS